jgi:outer membrane autotransporter protein
VNALTLGIGIDVQGGTVSGKVQNSGKISVTSGTTDQGIIVASSASVSGAVANSGAITVSAAENAGGIVIGATSAAAVFPGTVSGGIANSGSIAVSADAHATGISVNGGSTIAGGIANSGRITASSPGVAIGIGLGVLGGGAAGATATITGGVTNSGTITATGGKSGIGIAVNGNTPVSGGITNTGTITGHTAAISLAGETGVANTVTQSAGALIGSVIGSGNTKGDVLNVTGGRIVLSGGQSIFGFGTYNQSGGTLVFNVTQSTAPGTYPTLSAGSINLKGGTFELVPATSSIAALAAQHTTVFKNIIAADPPLSGSFASVTSGNAFFTASLSPDASTANALDASLTLSAMALAASAQDLTQDGRLGLDAPRVLTQAVQDRLVANGGALGEWLPGAASGVVSKGPAGFSFGNTNLWARGADQFGSATPQATSASVGYDINRAAPFIVGVDWRLDNNIVAGVAATYAATSAKFKDGSITNVNSYRGAAYAGWAGGPWYALGSAVVSINEFGTSRVLTPFGLPGAATSSSSGQSYQGHAEAGYHFGLPAAGVNLSVTPYAALDYVNAQVEGFSENGGFGAVSVNSTDSNSFQTTLGVRLTSRIAIANAGTLIPELRLGWSHEFLDASQEITAALVGVPGSTFTSTGIAFGRDAALIGAGFSLELSPDAKVFVDYDGRLASRVQEHSVSGGLRVRF